MYLVVSSGLPLLSTVHKCRNGGVRGDVGDVGDASVPTPHPFHPRPYGYFPLQEGWCERLRGRRKRPHPTSFPPPPLRVFSPAGMESHVRKLIDNGVRLRVYCPHQLCCVHRVA